MHGGSSARQTIVPIAAGSQLRCWITVVRWVARQQIGRTDDRWGLMR
jgi:hypothetical protein